MATDTTRTEDCRYAVRHHLAVRFPAAQDAPTILRHLARGGYDFSLDEVRTALHFLSRLDPPQVEKTPSDLGATLYWSATSAGILADERGE